MSDQKKEGYPRLQVLLILAGAVFVSFLLSFLLGQSGIFRLRQLKAEYEKVQIDNFNLAHENRKLAQNIQNLRHDAATVEKIAREELHLVSPHDLVLVVPDEQTDK